MLPNLATISKTALAWKSEAARFRVVPPCP